MGAGRGREVRRLGWRRAEEEETKTERRERERERGRNRSKSLQSRVVTATRVGGIRTTVISPPAPSPTFRVSAGTRRAHLKPARAEEQNREARP